MQVFLEAFSGEAYGQPVVETRSQGYSDKQTCCASESGSLEGLSFLEREKRLLISISPELFVGVVPYMVKKNGKVCLINVLLGSAKMATWLTRRARVWDVAQLT